MGFASAISKTSNLIARRVGPIHGKLVANPDYIKAHGVPETPEELLSHQALMQGTETWQFTDGDKTVSVHPQGRFKADDGAALAVAAAAGLGIAWLPTCLVDDYLGGGPCARNDTLSSSHGRTFCRPSARTAPRAKGSGPY